MTGRRLIDRIKHAFAVEDPEDFEPTERERLAAEKICEEVVRRRMTLPASMLLEMSRPLNYLGAQALHFFTPFASVLVDGRSWEDFAAFVERRGSVEYLIRTIEDCETAAKAAKDAPEPEEPSEAGPEADPADGSDTEPDAVDRSSPEGG